MNVVLAVLAAYLILILGIAFYFSRRESLSAYFSNSRGTGLWLLTFSTVATVIGAGATVAVVSEVYATGISYGFALPLSFIVGMLIFAFMAKKMKEIGDKYDATTLVDFFEHRFDKKNKILVNILQIFLLIIWTAVQAIAIASLASVVVGINYTLALLIAAAITILYTSLGGLKVDIITDFIQFWIIFFVFIIMAVVGYAKIGSFSNLLSQLPEGHLNFFALGVPFMIGLVVMGGFIYLGSSIHWQRTYSAKSKEIARNSYFLSLPFMIVLSLIIVFLGLLAAVLLHGIPQDTAIFSLMTAILPPWLAGLGFAAILAVVMSSVDSLLVGGSTIIYNAFLKNKTNPKRGIMRARILTVLFGICGFGLAFLVPSIVTLTMIVTYFALIFAPPIIAGIYSKKTSSDASFYALLIPSIILIITYPFLKLNTFLVSTPLSVLIIIFYDKIARKVRK
ncbi:MAG: sodium:solute symporter family protein [Candidatus Nanoarchaeia archaeon]